MGIRPKLNAEYKTWLAGLKTNDWVEVRREGAVSEIRQVIRHGQKLELRMGKWQRRDVGATGKVLADRYHSGDAYIWPLTPELVARELRARQAWALCGLRWGALPPEMIDKVAAVLGAEPTFVEAMKDD